MDENKLKAIRDGWFAHKTGKMASDSPEADVLRQMIKDIKDDFLKLDVAEKYEVGQYLFHTVPEAEHEAAVEYLKRTVLPASFRQLIGIIESDKRNAVATRLEFPALLNVRNLLRRGGFTWNDTYLDNLGETLILEAAKRFADEDP